MRPVFFRIWGALISRTRQNKFQNAFLPSFLTSQSNNHTLDIDTLFLVPIQCLGHTDVYKISVEKLSKDSVLQANSPAYKLSVLIVLGAYKVRPIFFSTFRWSYL